ncbi:MAG: arginine decarboxylase [Chloroflexi bacterium]|nr:MAG: arginine decarboxylase [Chloroflexota bacterium]
MGEAEALDQREAPFWDGLLAYIGSDAQPFSTPGHKRGRGAPADARAIFQALFDADIPHGGGVDTTQRSFDYLRRAERLAAAAHGGDDARFLVNGSTTGNLALLLTTCGDGDEVIVSRMLHKSVLAGIIFSGARPVYVVPEIDPQHNLPLDVPPQAVAAALEAHPQARAVVLVSPSYVGISSNLPEIAALCHAAGVPLLVDEAWGPHFRFHPALPPSAMQAGADAGVSSTHKMLSALTQGSTLVARRGLLDLERLGTMVDMVQTTSPSALIFASLDASRRQMALHGEELLTHTLAVAARLRDALQEIDGLQVLGDTLLAGRPGVGWDPTRVFVDVHQLGLTGHEAEAVLRSEHGVYVEMSDLLGVELLVTIGDDEATIERAVRGFRGLLRHRKPVRRSAAMRSTGSLLFSAEQAISPREAHQARWETVAIGAAAGRISTEALTPYPPGIPLVAPGERLSRAIIEYLHEGVAEGMHITGPSDPTLETLRVVA